MLLRRVEMIRTASIAKRHNLLLLVREGPARRTIDLTHLLERHLAAFLSLGRRLPSKG